MKIMESIKEHPYMAAGGVFVLGIVLILILFSGGKSAPAVVQTPQSDTSGATQFAMAQLQSQTALGVASLGVQKSANDNAAAVEAQRIQASTQQNHDLQVYNTTVASGLINKDTAIGVSTIQANYLSHAADDQLSANLALVAAQKEVGLSTVDAQRAIGLAGIAEMGHESDNATQAAQWGYQTQQVISNNQLAGIISTNTAATTQAQIAAKSANLASILGYKAGIDNNQTQLHLSLDQNFRDWNQGQVQLDNNRTAVAIANNNNTLATYQATLAAWAPFPSGSDGGVPWVSHG